MVPVGQLGFAGGMSGAVEGGQQEVLAGGQSLVAFGDLGIDEVHQADLLGLVIESGHVAEAGQAGGGGRQGSLGLGEGRQDVVQGAEVGGADNFGFAVHALALAGIVVGAPVNDFGGEGGHNC